MRIISKFHDYYDAVMKSGQDRSLLYLRKKEEIELKDVKKEGRLPEFPHLRAAGQYAGYGFNSVRATAYLIGFCGKIYPVVYLTTGHYDGSKLIETYCYKIEEVDEFIATNYKKREVDGYQGKDRWNRDWPYGKRRIYFQEFFDEVKDKQGKYTEFFLKWAVPIFILTENKLILNGSLKDYEFFRLFNPYSAFQELQMYLGGLANPEKPIPHVSDKDLLEGKGFNKWSFRKPPSDGS